MLTTIIQLKKFLKKYLFYIDCLLLLILSMKKIIVLNTLKLTKSLSASEFALFILMNLRDNNATEIKNKIKTFRNGFKIAKGRERKFAKYYFIKNKLGTDKNFDTIMTYVDTIPILKINWFIFSKRKTKTGRKLQFIAIN